MPEPQGLTRGTPERGALFSPDDRYRYALWRVWSEGARLVVIGLNPSTADETVDDPTIRRCLRFAQDWDLGGLVMLNLFAFRGTQPEVLMTAADPIGPENTTALGHYTAGGACTPRILAAWGTYGGFRGRGPLVTQVLTDAGRTLLCWGKTAGGYPRHPLYVRAETQPVAYP